MMKNTSTVCLKCMDITSLKAPLIPSVYTLLKTLDRELEAGNQSTYPRCVTGLLKSQLATHVPFAIVWRHIGCHVMSLIDLFGGGEGEE